MHISLLTHFGLRAIVPTSPQHRGLACDSPASTFLTWDFSSSKEHQPGLDLENCSWGDPSPSWVWLLPPKPPIWPHECLHVACSCPRASTYTEALSLECPGTRPPLEPVPHPFYCPVLGVHPWSLFPILSTVLCWSPADLRMEKPPVPVRTCCGLCSGQMESGCFLSFVLGPRSCLPALSEEFAH